MGYRCRWRQIGRNDYVAPPGISDRQRQMIGELQLTLASNRKTIFDVYRNGEFFGQVRTNFEGQFYRLSRNDEFILVCFKWNSNDPHHGRALLALTKASYEKCEACESE